MKYNLKTSFKSTGSNSYQYKIIISNTRSRFSLLHEWNSLLVL